jgi:hypothetical protein
MSETPWVVFDAKIGKAVCQRCGEILNLPQSQPVYIVVAASEAFCKMHANCRETVDSEQGTVDNKQ